MGYVKRLRCVHCKKTSENWGTHSPKLETLQKILAKSWWKIASIPNFVSHFSVLGEFSIFSQFISVFASTSPEDSPNFPSFHWTWIAEKVQEKCYVKSHIWL